MQEAEAEEEREPAALLHRQHLLVEQGQQPLHKPTCFHWLLHMCGS